MFLLNAIRQTAHFLSVYRKRAKIAAELQAYNDRELNDLGIRRSDIAAIARKAAA